MTLKQRLANYTPNLLSTSVKLCQKMCTYQLWQNHSRIRKELIHWVLMSIPSYWFTITYYPQLYTCFHQINLIVYSKIKFVPLKNKTLLHLPTFLWRIDVSLGACVISHHQPFVDAICGISELDWQIHLTFKQVLTDMQTQLLIQYLALKYTSY